MVKKLAFILLILFSFSSSAQDEYYGTLLQQANEQYKQNNYDSALILFNEIERADLWSYNLFYNKGNAYFKNNQLPLAILYYEKAKKLKPNNADLKYNIKLANELITDKLEVIPEFFVTSQIKSVAGIMNSNYWAWLSVLMVFIASVLFGVYFISSSISLKKMFFLLFISTSGLFVASAVLGSIKMNLETNQSGAIVFQASLTVKSEPSNNAIELFVLHEGTKVEILETSNDWIKISLPNGDIGWVNSSSIRII